MELKGKKITIIGLSKTGVAASRALVDIGAEVTVSDIKNDEELQKELNELKGLEINFKLGGHPEELLNCDLVVVSPGVPLSIPFFKKARERNINVISEIELGFKLTDARIIAVTGTNGKTTTTSLLGKIMKNGEIGEVKIAGNIGIPLIQEVISLNKEDWAVVEVSSFQLETIKDFCPEISLYLNISEDHLDWHKTYDNYWKAKKNIFKNQKSDNYAILNYDDTEVLKAAEDCQAEKLMVSMKKEVKHGVFKHKDRLFFNINGNVQELININQIPLRGSHNIENTAFAAIAAYLAGVELENIRKMIKNYKGQAHRLEEVYKDQNILVIDDSKATNPDAAVKALESINAKDIILIAGGQDRNANFKNFINAIIKKTKILILLGETSEKIKEQVLSHSDVNIDIEIVDNIPDAVEYAFINITYGDCLLLSPGCPSWDMFESYKTRGKIFQNEVFKKIKSFL